VAPERIRRFIDACAHGAILDGMSGGMIGASQTTPPTWGLAFNLKAFAIVELAGLGHVRGIVGASLLVAVAESIAATMVPAGDALRNAVFFAIIFLVLIWRSRKVA